MSILPTRRLLWLVLGAAALAVASGPMPEIAPVWLLGLFAVGLAALGDLCATLARPRAEAAAASPVTRFTKGRTGSVRVSFACPPGSPGTVRFALGMPEAFEPERDQLWVAFPPGARRAEIDWCCTPSRRGRFGGVLACTEHPSRLGLWQVRTRQPLATELRVYPGLPLAARRLLARTLRHGPAGVRAHRLMGRGREFEKLRDFHWCPVCFLDSLVFAENPHRRTVCGDDQVCPAKAIAPKTLDGFLNGLFDFLPHVFERHGAADDAGTAHDRNRGLKRRRV